MSAVASTPPRVIEQAAAFAAVDEYSHQFTCSTRSNSNPAVLVPAEREMLARLDRELRPE